MDSLDGNMSETNHRSLTLFTLRASAEGFADPLKGRCYGNAQRVSAERDEVFILYYLIEIIFRLILI